MNQIKLCVCKFAIRMYPRKPGFVVLVAHKGKKGRVRGKLGGLF